MHHRRQHHKGRNQRRDPNWHTQSQEERYREDQRARLAQADENDRKQAEEKAHYDALSAEAKAAQDDRLAALRARIRAEYLWQLACREKLDRDRRDSQSLGT